MVARPQLCLGNVMHRRLRPVVNAFVYPVFYVRLPLRRLETARCGLFSLDHFNLFSFHRRDHGRRDGSPLLPWIEGLLAEHGLPHDGEIILQTFPRLLGFVFNPVSFWFCHHADGRLIAILAEVNNTFGGTHSYLLHRDGETLADGDELRAEKVFHVSPFNEVVGGYRFRFRLARAVQQACIDYDDGEGALLLTSISGQARAWSAGALFGAFLRMPWMTLGVVLRIHWQALKLWINGVPFRGAHPSRRTFQESTK
ncbi:DUF1365 domain-containing protein [uncultured Propionivibrio sp.]|uniref:DUF1365 domain-containing protein n=1 Tax=uncultured Propionivibrio sp. TaxID=426737 RepID=UPI0029C064E0|nr:DUF1365 domain-containing protein [uncultured Propionivibrio sp.]